MRFIRGPDQARRIDDPDVRRLVEQRYAEICADEAYQEEVHGRFIVVEPGDAVADLEKEIGFPVMANPLDGTQFPDAEFSPICEVIERHKSAYELVLIFNDEGTGSSIFVPMHPGIDPQLTALCEKFAEPALEPTPP